MKVLQIIGSKVVFSDGTRIFFGNFERLIIECQDKTLYSLYSSFDVKRNWYRNEFMYHIIIFKEENWNNGKLLSNDEKLHIANLLEMAIVEMKHPYIIEIHIKTGPGTYSLIHKSNLEINFKKGYPKIKLG